MLLSGRLGHAIMRQGKSKVMIIIFGYMGVFVECWSSANEALVILFCYKLKTFS